MLRHLFGTGLFCLLSSIALADDGGLGSVSSETDASSAIEYQQAALGSAPVLSVAVSDSAQLITPPPLVTRVVVRKSQRVLLLMQNDSPLRVYPVALGDEPIGHKRFEGDERTPEGVYTLDWRNPNSRYTLSIHVSYPNEADRKYADSLGFDPGGMIMIHGRPNDFERSRLKRYTEDDWTDGCIAVSNVAMREIWDLVPLDTPIEILP